MLSIPRALFIFTLVVAFSCNGIAYAQQEDIAQQPSHSLKPAAPKLDTSKPEPPLPAPPLVPAKPKSTLQGKVEHSHNAAQPRSIFGHARTDSGGLYRQSVQQRTFNSGITTGIGIIGVKFVLFAGHSPVVNRVFATTPAADAGIQPDDVIVAVDGIPTRGLRKEEVYDMIVGTPGTAVTLSLERDGDFKVYNLTRMNLNELRDPAIRSDYLRSM